jgi:hypothetical protein
MRTEDMKCFTYSNLIVALLLLFTSWGCRSVERYTRYDLNTKYETTDHHYIAIRSYGTGGELTIRDDGSGALGYGTGSARAHFPIPGGYFERGTFDFAEVSSSLELTCTPQTPSGQPFPQYIVQLLVSEVRIEPCWEWFHGQPRRKGPYRKCITLYSKEGNQIDGLFEAAVKAIQESIAKSRKAVEEREARLKKYQNLTGKKQEQSS